MGYVNFTVGIGWSIGSIIAGHMYQEQGDKVELARRYLVEEKLATAEEVAKIFFGQSIAAFPPRNRMTTSPYLCA